MEKKDIKEYYRLKLEQGLGANTVRKHHANIHKCLGDAVEDEILKYNPAADIKLPKITPFNATYLNEDEMNTLLGSIQGTPMEVPIHLALYFGLRRSEIVGLKWDAIDFKGKRLIVQHVFATEDKNRTKNQASHDSFPLDDIMLVYLSRVRQQQKANQRIWGDCYQKNDYVCVRENGERIPADYLTRNIKKLLERCGVKVARFHDLRHSTASLLINQGCNLKQVQSWLRHSEISTTGDIYGHLDSKSKDNIATQMSSSLKVG